MVLDYAWKNVTFIDVHLQCCSFDILWLPCSSRCTQPWAKLSMKLSLNSKGCPHSKRRHEASCHFNASNNYYTLMCQTISQCIPTLSSSPAASSPRASLSALWNARIPTPTTPPHAHPTHTNWTSTTFSANKTSTCTTTTCTGKHAHCCWCWMGRRLCDCDVSGVVWVRWFLCWCDFCVIGCIM